jgi:hypothetical protein
MAQGESLRSICRSDGMPALGSVFRWVADDLRFREQYEAAMAQRAEGLFEEILEIADSSVGDTTVVDGVSKSNFEVVARSRLRVDARKWMLSKMLPKKYGDKLAIGGAEDMPPVKLMSNDALETKIAELQAKLRGAT